LANLCQLKKSHQVIPLLSVRVRVRLLLFNSFKMAEGSVYAPILPSLIKTGRGDSPPLAKRFWPGTVEEVQGKVPVLAGTGSNPPIAAELARKAADAGVQGILAFPPYYPSMEDEGIVAYYKSIAEATPLGMLFIWGKWGYFDGSRKSRYNRRTTSTYENLKDVSPASVL